MTRATIVFRFVGISGTVATAMISCSAIFVTSAWAVENKKLAATDQQPEALKKLKGVKVLEIDAAEKVRGEGAWAGNGLTKHIKKHKAKAAADYYAGRTPSKRKTRTDASQRSATDEGLQIARSDAARDVTEDTKPKTVETNKTKKTAKQRYVNFAESRTRGATNSMARSLAVPPERQQLMKDMGPKFGNTPIAPAMVLPAARPNSLTPASVSRMLGR